MSFESKEKQEILTEWVREYSRELYAWSLSKTSNPTLSEDIVQETFLAAAENLNKFQGDSHPKTWLFGILKNKIADYYRKQNSRPRTLHIASDNLSIFFDDHGRWGENDRPIPWGDTSDNIFDDHNFQTVLNTCINKLSNQMRSCLYLTYFQGKKGADICQETGLTATNYWKIMSRARLHMRDCLEKLWFRLNS